jgi:hypothetical protein
MPRPSKNSPAKAEPAAAPNGKSERLDARMLEALVGYNARRAWLIVSIATRR